MPSYTMWVPIVRSEPFMYLNTFHSLEKCPTTFPALIICFPFLSPPIIQHIIMAFVIFLLFCHEIPVFGHEIIFVNFNFS